MNRAATLSHLLQKQLDLQLKALKAETRHERIKLLALLQLLSIEITLTLKIS